MKLAEADLERQFAHIEAKFARVYAALGPRTYDDPGAPVEAYRVGDALHYWPIPVSGPARRYPGDGNRRERRKAAAERRRGR